MAPRHLIAACVLGLAVTAGCCGAYTQASAQTKIGLASIPVAISGNTWNLSQRQAVLNDQNPQWWHNFYYTREGETAPPGGGPYVPFLVNKSDLRNHSEVVTAVSEAASSRWILTLGEFDSREFTTDADAAQAWCDLLADSAIIAHPEIRLVSGYTVQDGSTGGSHFQNWLAAVQSNGCRLPDAIALDKYGGAGTAPATNAAAIMARLSNYIVAFPGYTFWIPEMGVLGAATSWNGTTGPSMTFADNGASGDTITCASCAFSTNGFLVGDTVKVTGAVASSGANNVTGVLSNVSATVLTFGASPALVNEGPITSARIGVTAGQVVTDASTVMTLLAAQLNNLTVVTHYSWWFTGPPSCCGGPYNSATQYLYDESATISPIGTTWKSLMH